MKFPHKPLYMEICVAAKTLEFEINFLNKESVHMGENYI